MDPGLFYEKIGRDREDQLKGKINALRTDNHLACSSKTGHGGHELDFRKMR